MDFGEAVGYAKKARGLLTCSIDEVENVFSEDPSLKCVVESRGTPV
jgi:hypothetical protein